MADNENSKFNVGDDIGLYTGPTGPTPVEQTIMATSPEQADAWANLGTRANNDGIWRGWADDDGLRKGSRDFNEPVDNTVATNSFRDFMARVGIDLDTPAAKAPEPAVVTPDAEPAVSGKTTQFLDDTQITTASLQAAHDANPSVYPEPEAYLQNISNIVTKLGFDSVDAYQNALEAKGIHTGDGLTNGLVTQLTLDIKAHDAKQTQIADVTQLRADFIAATELDAVENKLVDAIDDVALTSNNQNLLGAAARKLGAEDDGIAGFSEKDRDALIAKIQGTDSIQDLQSVIGLLNANGIKFDKEAQEPAAPVETPADAMEVAQNLKADKGGVTF